MFSPPQPSQAHGSQLPSWCGWVQGQCGCLCPFSAAGLWRDDGSLQSQVWLHCCSSPPAQIADPYVNAITNISCTVSTFCSVQPNTSLPQLCALESPWGQVTYMVFLHCCHLQNKNLSYTTAWKTLVLFRFQSWCCSPSSSYSISLKFDADDVFSGVSHLKILLLSPFPYHPPRKKIPSKSMK